MRLDLRPLVMRVFAGATTTTAAAAAAAAAAATAVVVTRSASDVLRRVNLLCVHGVHAFGDDHGKRRADQ